MENNNKQLKKCLVVFSGGQDSVTCLGLALNCGYDVEAITFVYGQKHSIEVEQSKKICEKLNVKQHIIDISFFGSIVESALTSNGDVNKHHKINTDLPASFVPNRNMMFLTIAHSLAQKIGAGFLMTGVSETDYSGYPDCREDFIFAAEKTLNLGSDSEILILTPLMFKDKKEVWKLSSDVGVIDIVKSMSMTCYEGSTIMNEWGYGCGNCPSCKLRRRGYEDYRKEQG